MVLHQPVFTGERAVPDDEASRTVFAEHLVRYEFAGSFARERRVLDAACGTGYGVAVLAEAGAEIAVGVEIDGASVEYARQRYGHLRGVRYIQADLRLLPQVVRERFDLCVSFETIEHLGEPERFLRDVAALLEPEGLLIVSTPNRYLYSPANLDGRRPWNGFHRIEWTIPEFIALLSRDFHVEALYGQVMWSRGAARAFHWMERVKQALPRGVWTAPLDRITRLSLRWWPGRPGGLGWPGQARGSDRVRSVAQDEVPLYVVCLCRKKA